MPIPGPLPLPPQSFPWAVRAFQLLDQYFGGLTSDQTFAGKIIGLAGRCRNNRQIIASATILSTDDVLSVLCPVACTLTMPEGLPVGTRITVQDESAAAATNNITIAMSGDDMVNGATSYVLSTNYGVVTFLKSDTQWIAG